MVEVAGGALGAVERGLDDELLEGEAKAAGGGGDLGALLERHHDADGGHFCGWRLCGCDRLVCLRDDVFDELQLGCRDGICFAFREPVVDARKADTASFGKLCSAYS